MSPVPQLQTTRIVIADDHPVVISGVVAGLREHPQMEIIETVGSFAQLAERLPHLSADILLLDLAGMSEDVGAATFVEGLRRTYPEMKIIILSSDVSLAPELLKAGAQGYVSKGEPQHFVPSAIVVVSAGHQFVSPSVQAYLDRCRTARGGSTTLTPQQLTIAKLLHQGLTTTGIASQLGIERETVLNHITEAKRRTGCTTRFEFVQWYLQCYGGV